MLLETKVTGFDILDYLYFSQNFPCEVGPCLDNDFFVQVTLCTSAVRTCLRQCTLFSRTSEANGMHVVPIISEMRQHGSRADVNCQPSAQVSPAWRCGRRHHIGRSTPEDLIGGPCLCMSLAPSSRPGPFRRTHAAWSMLIMGLGGGGVCEDVGRQGTLEIAVLAHVAGAPTASSDVKRSAHASVEK